ncbi:sensor histidine kinase [Kineococcus sp. LSe6-4]|uniref:histidine kinase n=1 Tax=Kineococcus halophytocola TaxID=3234027 RepID=A0ABV4H3F8_9ACTN
MRALPARPGLRRGLAEAGLVLLAVVDALIGLPYASTGATAAALVTACVLPLRRRLPWVTALVAAVGLYYGYALVAAMAVVFTLAVRTRGRRPVGVVAALVVLGGNLVATELPQDADEWVSAVLYGLLFATAPWALGELVVTRRELSRRLAEIDERVAREVLERERAVLAREMHDVVSHQVSLIAVQAGALQVTAAEETTRSAARTIRELSVRTLDELRAMVEVLRTAGGSARRDGPQPGVGDLDGLTAGCGLVVRSTVDVPGDLPAPVQRAVFRAVQEGLTNVRKHAPGAEVTVSVVHDGARTRVEVANGPATGPVLALPSARHGLLGLRERAALLDGQVHAAPTPAGGFRLVVTIPDP